MNVLLRFACAGVAMAGLTGCFGPTSNPPPGGALSPVPVLTFEGTIDSANWSAAAGYQNGATIAPLAMDTTNHGSISAGGRNYLKAGSGTQTWPDTVDLGNQTLKFVLRTDSAASGGSHVVVTFLNLDLKAMTGRTGVEFYLMVPGGPDKVGVSPILRYNDGTNENAVVFTAPLNDPTVENFTDPTNSSVVYDWVYFGDKVFLHFKVPFDCFSVPGWASGSYSTIAAALAGGVKFNEFNLDFRMDTTDASGGAINTDYPAYLDNVTFY